MEKRLDLQINESERSKKNGGFTLVELMVVILVIGILASIAVPKFMDIAVKAKLSEIPIVMASYEHAQLSYLAEQGTLATTTQALSFDEPASKWFTYTHSGGGGGDAVYTVDIKPGITIGKFISGCTASTTISPDGKVTHNSGVFGIKYLPNF